MKRASRAGPYTGETPSDRGRGVGAARELGRHLAQAERRAEAPPELRSPAERNQLRELAREPVAQGAVEAAHHGPARGPEHGRDVAHVADLVAQDLVVEEADARGDLRLVGEELDAAVTERAEDDAAGHLGAPGERPVPALGRADEELHDHARGERRRPGVDRQAEDRDRVGEDARIVVLLEHDVHDDRVVGVHPPVELAQADPEPLRLVRLGGGEQPQHAVVEPGLGPAAREVAEKGLAVDRPPRADRLPCQAVEERLAPGERVAEEVGLPVPRAQKGEVAVRHDALLPRAAPRSTSAVRTRRPRTSPPVTVPPAGAAITPPIGANVMVTTLLSPRTLADGSGPPSIARRLHFSEVERTGT